MVSPPTSSPKLYPFSLSMTLNKLIIACLFSTESTSNDTKLKSSTNSAINSVNRTKRRPSTEFSSRSRCGVRYVKSCTSV